jgi:D-mannonate dehydratase
LVKAIIDVGEHEDRVLTVVKGKYGLKNKNDAVNLIIRKYEETILEANLRPEELQAKESSKSQALPRQNRKRKGG